MKFQNHHVHSLRHHLTDAERHLWQSLRAGRLGVKFRRQHALGRFIVDFVCLEKRLIIEIDGGQHAGSVSDQARDAWLMSQGFQILRFWNNEVLQERERLLEYVWSMLNAEFPSPQPNDPAIKTADRMCYKEPFLGKVTPQGARGAPITS